MSHPVPWLAGALALVLAANGPGAPNADPKKEPLARRLAGEWSFFVSLKGPEDTELVWTLRANGVCRMDAVDRKSREQARLPTGPMHAPHPLVGRWRLEA